MTSDCAPLWGYGKGSHGYTTHDLHVIRDATRGGVGTVLYEIAGQSNVGIHLDAKAVPVQPEVKGVCGMLGLEPLYLACEGRLAIMAPKEEAEGIVETLRKCPYSAEAAIIGEVVAEEPEEWLWRLKIGHTGTASAAGWGAFAKNLLNRRNGSMDTRVALISIIVEQDDAIEELNTLLHEARQYIIGRMGIPYRAKGISIISIAIDAPQDKISALSGKIGRLKGVSAKTAYSNVITPAEGGAGD